MPRKTPEERLDAAVDALIAKRDRLQTELDKVNGSLAKAGIAIGAPRVETPEKEAELTSRSHPKNLQQLMDAAGDVPATERPALEAVDPLEDSDGNPIELAGGDDMGEGTWI